LNGCIPPDLLRTLASERNVDLSSNHYFYNDAADDDAQRSTQHNHNNNNHNTATISNTHNKHVRPKRSLHDCFDIFAELPRIVNDLTALEQITYSALQQFADHHTIYLELRSTPKRLLYHYQNSNTSFKCTKREYVETIIRVIKQFEQSDQRRYDQEVIQKKDLPRLPLTCRLIISIDRSQSIQEATENIELAISLKQHQQQQDDDDDDSSYIVGVDFGGNPMKQDFGMFQYLFQRARDAGLKVTIHCAEIECNIPNSKEYKETQTILQFRPDRIGHAVLLPPDLLQQLRELHIPVESCPTSNVLTLDMHCRCPTDLVVTSTTRTLTSTTDEFCNDDWIIHALRQHHTAIRHWIETKHPIVICTDDPGIFDTTISQEIHIVQQAYVLDASDIISFIENAITYSFCSVTTKSRIKNILRHRIHHRIRSLDGIVNTNAFA
jgi:adenosine deaminase